ncbi:MAG: hypothetical protein ACOYYU_12360 [Chloroflexota bacterium]
MGSRILEWKAAYSCIRGLFVDGLWARRLSVVREAPYGDDIESAVEVGLARARRLRHIIPEGDAVLRSAFEGRLA